VVLGNPKFMLFLLILPAIGLLLAAVHYFAGYVHAYIDPNARVELILLLMRRRDCFDFGGDYLTRAIPRFHAIIIGTLITSLSWLILAFHPSVLACYVSIFVLALGEIIHQPRYYEYISRLAPPGQQGTYMGFAFLPLGIGSLVGGCSAGG